MSEMTTITVSNWVKAHLDKIKQRNGHTSMDSVVRTLLLRDNGVNIKCTTPSCGYNEKGYCQAQNVEVDLCKTIWQRPSEVKVKLPEIKREE